MSIALYEWQARFNQEGLTFGLRTELLELLKPYVKISPPMQGYETDRTRQAQIKPPKTIEEIVDWEIVLGAPDVHHFIPSLANNPRWPLALAELLPHLSLLLLDALDLMNQLQAADDRSDHSYFHQPSISEHPQNQKFRDWTALIDLTRDAFLEASKIDAVRAKSEAERWTSYPYPLFRRLAFFAATATDLIAPSVCLKWLLADHHWWLWSVETEREGFRLLNKLASLLKPSEKSKLISAILEGPPVEMFRSDIDPREFTQICDHEIWLRLAKYERALGQSLEGEAADALKRISRSHPNWRVADDESDEFPIWMGGKAEWNKRQNSPKELPELKQWLMIERDDLSDDDWRDRCKDDFSTTSLALIQLGEADQWPIQRWRTALQIWSDQTLILQSWNQVCATLLKADNEIVKSLAGTLSFWLQAAAKVIKDNESSFFTLVRRVLESQRRDRFISDKDPVFKAINHPIGQATDAIFRWWFRQGLEDGQGLAQQPRELYSRVSDLNVEIFRYGRVILAANLIALFRVDRAWTERRLLPNFEWENGSEEASAAWCGFLWAPRLYAPLFTTIKQQFLDTAAHYTALGQFAQQYANLLTFIALELPESFTKKELAIATAQLPPEGLSRCAMSLVQALNSAEEKRLEYWNNRVAPYIKDIWPKSADATSPAIANSFARLCMQADEAFPLAVALLNPWLSRATHPDVALFEFKDMDLAERFPDASLAFLDSILTKPSFALGENISQSLEKIESSAPKLRNDARFERLTRLSRQLGG